MVLLAVSVYEMRGWRIGTERGGVVAILCRVVFLDGVREGILWCVECGLGRGLGVRLGQFRKRFCQAIFGEEEWWCGREFPGY